MTLMMMIMLNRFVTLSVVTKMVSGRNNSGRKSNNSNNNKHMKKLSVN